MLDRFESAARTQLALRALLVDRGGEAPGLGLIQLWSNDMRVVWLEVAKKSLVVVLTAVALLARRCGVSVASVVRKDSDKSMC